MKKTSRYFDVVPKRTETAEEATGSQAALVEESSPFAQSRGFQHQKRTFPRHSTKPKQTFPTKLFKQRATDEVDPFPGIESVISAKKIEKFSWGDGMKLTGVKTKFAKSKLQKREAHYQKSAIQAARAQLLHQEDQGFLEPDEGEFTFRITQKQIVDATDITSATKHFELDLPKFGPYHINYTRNGRHLLIGGRRGHVATFDWLTKQLHCETNVMEIVRDVQWLHIETMFAVAQKQWTYIYDSQGVELHCLKNLNDALRLEFLPYHFLLVAGTKSSFLHWLDVSVGKLVQSYATREGRIDVMCQNPANAIIHCGHPRGTVTLWSPNVKEPLVKMLCHPAPVRGVTIDPSGTYMATTGQDKRVRVWDIRKYKQVASYGLPMGVGHVAFSQRRLLAVGVDTNVQVFKKICTQEVDSPYMIHDCRHMVTDLQFCPNEDVLGVGHQGGFTSLLIPGAGEANIDALESNPYQSKQQRREFEVKALLDKIQPDMITLDTSAITEVDTGRLEEHLEDKAKTLFLKPEKIDFEPRRKKKGKGSSLKMAQRKKRVHEQIRRERSEKRSKTKQEVMEEIARNHQQEQGVIHDEPPTVLDRFKRKD